MRGSKREKRTGVWELRVFLGRDKYTGKILQKSETFHGGARGAEDRLRHLVADAEAGRFGGGSATVSAALEAWLEHRKGLKRSPTTIVNYASKIKTIDNSPLGPVRLSKLTAEHINGFYRERLQTNSPTTVHHYHRIISGALRFVESQEWIDWHGRSPASKAEPPQQQVPKGHAPTVEDVRRLISAAEASRQPKMADAMRLAALLIIRRGEVCGLKWSDIDWGQDVATIRRSIYQIPGEIGEKPTKSNDTKEIELGPAGVALLRRIQERALAEAHEAGVELLADGYVLADTEDGRLPWTPSRITQFTTRLRNRLEIPDFHFHSLRGWTSSALVAAGIDVRNVAGRAGHHDHGITLLQHYAHRDKETDRRSAKILGELLGLPDVPDEAAEG